MRTFTKSLLTFLLLLVVGSMAAQSLQVIKEIDYADPRKADGSKADGYPYYWMGDSENQPYFCDGTATVQIVDGALEISNTEVQSNNYSLQPFILDWFNTTVDEDYVIRIWLKADMDGSANLSIGTWGTSGNATVEFKQSEDFVMYSINHTAAVTSTGNDEHILWQMGSTVGTVWIKKVQILQAAEEKPILSTYGTYRSIIINSDMEATDETADSCFYTKIWTEDEEGNYEGENLGEKSPVLHSVIVDGVGVDGSRGIKVETKDKVKNPWDSQFWFRFTEDVPSGTKYKVSFDYMADLEGEVATQAHAEPGDYIHYEMFGNINFQSDWEHFEKEGSVTSQQSTNDKKFRSVAFNLNDIADANTFYFDNIDFMVYEPGIDAQFKADGIKILFPYYTNIIRLMKKNAKGKTRYLLPTSCFKVTADNEEMEIASVEADIEGSIMIFFNGDIDEDAEKVIVKFTNPEEVAYRLLLLDSEEAVENFEVTARYNESLIIVSDKFNKVSLMESVPEEGSFNLKGDINNFKLTFDKEVNCAKLEAKLGNEPLTVEPATGYAIEVTLKRTATEPLADGDYKLTVTKIEGKTTLETSECEVNFSVGVKVSEELTTALNDAKTVQEANIDENNRYAGDAFTALSDAITKYETEGPNYTAPSQVDAAVLDLNDKVKAMNAHHKLVDEYDEANSKIQKLAEDLAESKFNSTELYLQLKALAEKYADKLLTIDDSLTAANKELKPMADLCGNMFTEGVSNNGDAGYKVLTDRIRMGIETLINLGTDEADPIIVEAKKAISDDDKIANKIKYAITEKLYTQMANPDPENPLFKDLEEEDEEGNPLFSTVDMSVFIKNPNMYALLPKNGFNAENMPGWTVVKGNPGFYGAGGDGWGNPRNIEGLPEDIAVTTYHSEAQVEQTITDLPAGIYNVSLIGTDWGNTKGDDGEGPDALGFVYVKTSSTIEPEEGEAADRDINFDETATIEYAGQYQMNRSHDLKNIVVTDGQLTIGFYYGNDSQYFFGDAKLALAGAATGFDYAKALTDLTTSIDATKSAKVRAIQLFDLNGRSINKSQKGITIVKKVMSDGTIKTEKVVK